VLELLCKRWQDGTCFWITLPDSARQKSQLVGVAVVLPPLSCGDSEGWQYNCHPNKSMKPFAQLATLAVTLATLVALTGQMVLAAAGQLELTVVDKDTGKPIACRMHLLGPNKKPRKPDGVPYWHDHFAVPGKILLKLPLGNYTFLLERGPEYLDRQGYFTINHFADDTKTVDLRRFIDMAADGWWSGDLDVRRPIRDIELLMEADDLHVAQVIAWQNDKSQLTGRLPKEPLVRFDTNRYYQWTAGALARSGTEVLLLNLPAPLKLPVAEGEYPPLMKYLTEARANSLLKKGTGSEPTSTNHAKDDGSEVPVPVFHDLWVDLSKPFWWDLPMLAAAGQIDSIELAHSHICRETTINDEADGKPRDRKRYASYKGNAEWSHEVYFRLLECGLRIPPTAGSGSGDTPNPVGYNRVYAHVDGDFSYDAWWKSLRAGQVFITNGPLMKPSVEGQLPGHVFQAEQGSKLEFEIGLTFSTRDPITYLEIIKDGHVEHEIRFDEYAKIGKLPKLAFDRSGWFLVRAVTDVPKTYRFAMTGPYYVEIGYQRRISKKAAQFFLDWVVERAKQIKLADPQQQREALQWHRQARDFWQDLVSKANAD